MRDRQHMHPALVRSMKSRRDWPRLIKLCAQEGIDYVHVDRIRHVISAGRGRLPGNDGWMVMFEHNVRQYTPWPWTEGP